MKVSYVRRPVSNVRMNYYLVFLFPSTKVLLGCWFGHLMMVLLMIWPILQSSMMVFNENFQMVGVIRLTNIYGLEVKKTFLRLCIECSVNAWIGCLFFMCKDEMIYELKHTNYPVECCVLALA